MPLRLEASLDELLLSGGDNRLILDTTSGLNKYGCSPRPRNVTPFGSCTSSSISPRGYAAARQLLQTLRNSDDFEQTAEECADMIRARLSETLQLPEDVDIALAPSGTDVEYLAIALAAGETKQRIVNIVIGPTEVGSGTPAAAGGRHYDTRTPTGETVAAGESITSEFDRRVDVQTIDIRGAGGQPLPESEIDAAVNEAVINAYQRDVVVVLHVVAHSKTGVFAPSQSCVERLCDIYPELVVVVDAAQGRVSSAGLRSLLSRGYLVIFTGSKFYGGPPFSGALLVPHSFLTRQQALPSLSAGFGRYFCAAELPQTWMALRASLPTKSNVGVLLRWAAALAEMEAYYDVPETLRDTALQFFERETPLVLGESPVIDMLPNRETLFADAANRGLESRTTVFGFWVKPPGRNRPLEKAELSQLHAQLNRDISADYPDCDADVTASCFHLGQPVNLGAGGVVLRIAIGGELIVRVATDRDLGDSFLDRLSWLKWQMVGLRKKLELLVSGEVSRRTLFASAERVSNR